jgi:WD40 repeat protein
LDHIPRLSLETLRTLGIKGIAFTAKGSSFSECLFNLTGHVSPVYSLIELSDGRLASASHDATIKLWDTTDGICLATLIGHAWTITTLIKLNDGRLVSASWDKTIKIWIV